MRSLPITSAVAAAAVVCLLTHAAVAFTKNIVRGGDSTVSGAYNYWDVGNECQMSGNSFSVEDTCAIGCNRDCYMTQSIDITFAKNYLLNPGAKVLVSMLGFIQGSDPDYASLTLSLLECTSGNTITLGGNQIETDSWATYTWGMWLPPNICTATVQLHLRNHAWDGDNPRAQTISLTLTGTGGSRSVALNATESATKTEERPTLTQSTSLAYTNTPTLTQDAPSSTSTQSSVLSLTTTSTQSSSVVSSQSLTNSSSPPSGTRSRDSSTWSTSPSRSSSPTGLITASPSQSHSPTRSISTSASSSASYSASQSNSASMSADGRTATATAVTFTGNYSETVGQLTLTRTLLLTESKIFQTKTNRHSSTPTISFNETTVTTALAHTNASSTPTFVTPVVSTTASALPLRTATPLPNASMTLTFIVPPPATQAPVSLVAEAALTSVTTAAILAAASSAAGPASMQAIMFQASCGEGGNAIGSAGARSSTMYLVSPFIGDSFAMVGGNIGLMFGFLLLHVCVLMVARCTALGKRNPRAAAALVRFPQISLLFAGTAMQGVMLGGWQLLWLVIRGETDDPAKAIICFVIALAAPALLFAGLWKLRTALLMPRICNTFWAVSVANRKRAQAKRIPYDGVGLDGLLIPKPWLRSLMRATGPSHLWTPQQHRAMFGAALNEARPRNALQMRWPLLESCVVPVIIAGAASIRPPDEHRKIVCGVAMPLTALMIIIVALLIVIRCPFRVQFKNMHRPLSLLWIALTALASQPAVFDALGEATTTNILAALSLAQTLTLVSVVTINWLIYYYVDRRSVELIDSAVDQRFDTDDDEQASRSSGVLILAELDELWIADDDDNHDESLGLPMKELSSNNNSKDKFLDELGLIEVEMAASAARRRSSLTLSSSSRRTAPSSSSSSCSSNEARRHREIFIRGHLEEDEGELLTDLMAGYKRVIPTGRSASSSRRRTTAAAGAPRGSTPETLEWNSSAVTLPIEFNDIDEDDNDDCIGDSYGAKQNMATTTTAAVTQRHDEDDDALESLLVLNGKKVSGLRHQQHVQHEAEMFVVNDVERSVDTPLALRLSQGGEHIAEEQPDSLGSFVLPLGRSASFSRRAPPVWSAHYSASVTTLSENERGRQSQDDTEEDPLAFLLTT